MILQRIKKQGRLIIISSPSGGGKSTLCERLKIKIPELVYSVSTTTRPQRRGEKDEDSYFFITQKKFEKMIEQAHFAEWAQVHGYYYGTSKKVIDNCIRKGKTCILDIDVIGGIQLKKNYRQSISIFILAPSFKELERRLRMRKTDNEKDIKIRLKNAKKELEYQRFYDYVVVNNKIEDTVNKIVEILNKK